MAFAMRLSLRFPFSPAQPSFLPPPQGEDGRPRARSPVANRIIVILPPFSEAGPEAEPLLLDAPVSPWLSPSPCQTQRPSKTSIRGISLF